METFSVSLAICAENSPVNSLHEGQWRGTLMGFFICARNNGWVNNRKAGDLRRNRAHYDVIVMRDTTRSPRPRKTPSWLIFCDFSQISDLYFQGQTLYWPHLRNGWFDWHEMKRKCVSCIMGEPCDLDLWPHLRLFKVKFRNSCITRIVGLIDVKWKGSESISYWADYMILIFDNTHDIDLEGSRSKI